MRSFLVGVTVLMLGAAVARGQASGEVESIGFNNIYRPDCWTPMVVRLKSETGRSGTFQLQVIQEDLDRDKVIYWRNITLTGNLEGQSQREERFWMYFIPQPTNGGLMDTSRGGTLKDLQAQGQLRVSLCTESGKQIKDLPLTSTITSLDPYDRGQWNARKGTKLILAVTDGRSQPAWREYQSDTRGILESVEMVALQVRDLPENVIGFEAVDAIVWMAADPALLVQGGEQKRQALQSWVRQGGRLVICQSPQQWQTILSFGEMLPVQISGVEDKADLQPLKKLATPREGNGILDPTWSTVKGPFKVGRAQAKPGAVVEEWIHWDGAGNDRSPWLVRQPYGLGSVTWVAQDLGDPALTVRAKGGWPHVWDKVFDWKNDTIIVTPLTPEDRKNDYVPANAIDLGFAFFKGMELGKKTRAMMGLAIGFFIVYWLVAGPGTYLYLAAQKRAILSWFIFAAAAIVATGLTVLLVKVVVRGPPQMRHISLVRGAPGQPAVVESRFGLYIPRDGTQEIKLEGAAEGSVSYVTPFASPPHEHWMTQDSNPTGMEYKVAIRDATSDDVPAIEVPYRSTLKKMQAHWVGEGIGMVEGSAAFDDQLHLEGVLTNGTGRELRELYIAYNDPQDWDWIFFVPKLAKGESIDLRKMVDDDKKDPKYPFLADNKVPTATQGVRGRIGNPGAEQEWATYWYPSLRAQVNFSAVTPEQSDARAFPMMSLFDRLPPPKTRQSAMRFELLRRAGRKFDLSHALSAGGMVVLAKSDDQSPLPFPLEVQGDKVTGTGTTYYQFVLPVDRSRIKAESDQDSPATQPSTQPAAPIQPEQTARAGD